MTLSEQIDKFANETRDTVDIICRIAKRQGKEEALDVIEDIKAEIEQIADEEQKHDEKWAIGLRYAVKIINKYKTGSEENEE